MSEFWNIDDLSAGIATGREVGPTVQRTYVSDEDNWFEVGPDYCTV